LEKEELLCTSFQGKDGEKKIKNRAGEKKNVEIRLGW
jgi:hypothetical protein